MPNCWNMCLCLPTGKLFGFNFVTRFNVPHTVSSFHSFTLSFYRTIWLLADLWSWNRLQQCPLTRWTFVPSFIQINKVEQGLMSHRRSYLGRVFSEPEWRSLYVIARPSVIGNIHAPYSIFLRHLVRWPSADIQVKFYRESPPLGELNTRILLSHSAETWALYTICSGGKIL